jgi:hypothetical protein
MDESGKFADSEVVAMSSVVSLNQAHMGNFRDEWASLLVKNGLEFLEMKEALRIQRPLSEKVAACSAEERTEILVQFVRCMRRHLNMILGVAIDVREYRSLPEQHRAIWSDNPIYTAFTRSVLEIVNACPPDGFLALYCDDEEQTALPFYKLYRTVKIQYPDAHKKLKGIMFADDRLSFPLQAADLTASIVRLEALLRFRSQEYQFRSLFDALTADPAPDESIFQCGVAWCDKEQLSRIAQSYNVAKRDHQVVKLSDLSEEGSSPVTS